MRWVSTVFWPVLFTLVICFLSLNPDHRSLPFFSMCGARFLRTIHYTGTLGCSSVFLSFCLFHTPVPTHTASVSEASKRSYMIQIHWCQNFAKSTPPAKNHFMQGVNSMNDYRQGHYTKTDTSDLKKIPISFRQYLP